jgi:hypothetical protein
MRVATILTIGLALSLCSFTAHEIRAEIATQEEMELVCKNWLAYMVHQTGGWAGETRPEIGNVQELFDGDILLARSFSISPRGYVAVPVLKELPPIKAYSEKHGLDVDQTVGFPQLLREVLLHRIKLYLKTYGSLDATQPSTGEVLFGRINRAEWDRLLISRDKFEAALHRGAFSPLAEVGPLLTTSWHQMGPYWNYCPFGDGDTCLVGCVATAAAQIMRYFEWPLNGVGSHTYWWNGDQSCGRSTPGQNLSANFSDPYDWDNMPDSCDFGCSPDEENALAELCYEVGVAFEMDYGACASGTWTYYALTVFPTYFRYDDTIDREDRGDHTAQEWFDLIKAEINKGRPMQYRIYGHSIVCDGWRDTGGENQYHINYGWGDPHTTWYAIDHIYGTTDPEEYEYLIRNIMPPSPEAPSNLECSYYQYEDEGCWYLTWDDNSDNEDGWVIMTKYQGPWDPIGEYVGPNHSHFTWKEEYDYPEREFIVGAYIKRGAYSDTAWSNVATNCPFVSTGCPFVWVWDGEQYVEENNIVPPTDATGPGSGFRGPSIDEVDYYVLETQPVVDDSLYRFRIKEIETEQSWFDQFVLWIVDHDQEEMVLVNADGELVICGASDSLGNSPIPPDSCRDQEGKDCLPLIDERDGLAFAGEPGDTIIVKFRVPEEDWSLFLPVEDHKNYYSIAVDQQMFESFWYAVGHLHPRERWHMDLMELRDPIGPGDLRLRLRFLEEHGVDQLALGKRLSSQVERQVTDLVSANHSRLGTVLEQLLQIDGIRVDLLPGEWIDLSFPAPPDPGEGFVRSFILVSSGHYQTIP